MTPDATKAINDLVNITGNHPETVRRICEYTGHEPADIACMAINRMYTQLFGDNADFDFPSEEELDAVGAVPAPTQPGEAERLIEQMRAAGERQADIAKKYAP